VLRNRVFVSDLFYKDVPVFLYALRREVLRNTFLLLLALLVLSGFYTPFGVRCFGTLPPWTGR